MLVSAKWGAGLWLGMALSIVSGCGPMPANGDSSIPNTDGSDASSLDGAASDGGADGADAALDASADGAAPDAAACVAGEWCREPHAGPVGTMLGARWFAGSLSAPPLAVINEDSWAVRDGEMRWTYSAFPTPMAESEVAAVMQGYDAANSWVGAVNNGGVYHWSPTLGMRGFRWERRGVAMEAARSSDTLWVNERRDGTWFLHRWRAGAWREFALPGAQRTADSMVIDEDGSLLVIAHSTAPPGVRTYTVYRLNDAGVSELMSSPMLVDNTVSSPFLAPAFTRDRAGALWIDHEGAFFRRASGSSTWASFPTSERVLRATPSERGIAAVLLGGDSSAWTYSLSEIDSATQAASARAIRGASIGASVLHVTNAAMWRIDQDASIWRLSTP